nr:restriction endonuclease subunit S [Agathobacter rectalis]
MPYEKIGKNEPVCIADDVPFEIPESWEWVRWGTLSESIQYGYNAPAQENGRIKMVRISDIQDNSVMWETVPYCDIKEGEIDAYLLKPNDILFARTGGTVGKSYLVQEVPEEAIYAGYLIRTRYSNQLCPQYLKYFMESELYWSQLREGTIATAQPNCNGKTLGNMLVPIPPSHEQIRIVEKLNAVMAHVIEYGTIDSRSKHLNNIFPERLKKSILQEAVQGKLVPQDPNDEPAAVLLERIRAEKQKLIAEGKIKKNKHESIIFRRDNSHYEKCGSNDVCIDDEIPFDIPNSWCWTRLDNIITVRGGKRLPKGEKLLESPTGHVYIRVTDMKNNSVDLNDLHYIDDKIYREISNYIITKDDIYIVIVGSTIGKVGIIPNELDGMNLTENAARLTPYLVDKEYLLLALQTEYLQRQFLDKTNQVGQPKLALIRLKTSLIPMPPLEEQKRIAQMYKHLLLPVSDL